MRGMSQEKWQYIKNLSVQHKQRFVRCDGVLYEVTSSFYPTGPSPAWSVEEVDFLNAAPFVSTWQDDETAAFEPPSPKL